MASITVLAPPDVDVSHPDSATIRADETPPVKSTPAIQMPTASSLGVPAFDDPHKAREYLKGRLALAFRIFAKFGYEEGVAGHITLRVSDRNGTVEAIC